APDESAYRSLTQSWFLHSPLLDTLRKISERRAKVILTTDHGTIRVKRPFKIIGDRNVNTNLRYKQGKNLGYDGNKLMEVPRPERLFLPKINVSTAYVFAIEDQDRKSTRLNSSHVKISYAVFCLKKKIPN